MVSVLPSPRGLTLPWPQDSRTQRHLYGKALLLVPQAAVGPQQALEALPHLHTLLQVRGPQPGTEQGRPTEKWHPQLQPKEQSELTVRAGQAPVTNTWGKPHTTPGGATQHTWEGHTAHLGESQYTWGATQHTSGGQVTQYTWGATQHTWGATQHTLGGSHIIYLGDPHNTRGGATPQLGDPHTVGVHLAVLLPWSRVGRGWNREAGA